MDNDTRLLGEGARELLPEILKQYGREAARLVRERAALSEDGEDGLAAKAWRDIADAIDRLNETDNETHDAPGSARAQGKRVEAGTEFYASPNGDRWLLICDPNSTQIFVRHESNAASGGHRSEITVREFFGQGERHPQHLALERLLKAAAASRDLT